ncbi:hypothetical protein ACOME3_009889 [Neoechinorhynchus agilis]
MNTHWFPCNRINHRRQSNDSNAPIYSYGESCKNSGTVRNLIYNHQASIERTQSNDVYRPFLRSGKIDGHASNIKFAKETLRTKIEHRPNKRVLIDQHILEDTNAAPSLQLQQHNLKRAKLADNLNVKLAKRPGPLELVEHNILETPIPVKEALKDGLIVFERVGSGSSTTERRSSTKSTRNNFACPNGGLIFHEYKGPNTKPVLSRLETIPEVLSANIKHKDYYNILLNNVKLADIQKECRRRNIPTGGNKQELLSRIVNHDRPRHNFITVQDQHLNSLPSSVSSGTYTGWTKDSFQNDNSLNVPTHVKSMAAAWSQFPCSAQNGKYTHSSTPDQMVYPVTTQNSILPVVTGPIRELNFSQTFPYTITESSTLYSHSGFYNPLSNDSFLAQPDIFSFDQVDNPNGINTTSKIENGQGKLNVNDVDDEQTLYDLLDRL